MDLKHIYAAEVARDWVDYNGHMNDAAYALVFSRAVDQFMIELGMDAEFRAKTNFTIYTLSTLIHYREEAKLGQKLDVSLQLLDYDGKRLRVWMDMLREGRRIASSEQLLVCVDQSGEAPRSAKFPHEIGATIEALAKAQSDIPHPKEAGQGISIRRN